MKSIVAVLCKTHFSNVAFVKLYKESHYSILNNLVYIAFWAKLIISVCRICTCVHYGSDNSIFILAFNTFWNQTLHSIHPSMHRMTPNLLHTLMIAAVTGVSGLLSTSSYEGIGYFKTSSQPANESYPYLQLQMMSSLYTHSHTAREKHSSSKKKLNYQQEVNIMFSNFSSWLYE